MHRLLRVARSVLVTVFLAGWASVALTGNAFAYIGQQGDPHPLGTVNTILVFIVGPLGVFGLLALLCLRPQRSAGAGRYRPGRPWPFAPTSFTGAGDSLPPEAASGTPLSSPGHGGAHGNW